MSGDRELDIEIAERVMGLARYSQEHDAVLDKRPGGVVGYSCRRCDWRGAVSSIRYLRTDSSCFLKVPRYSSDIAAAMTVFEAMVEMTGSGSISADMEDARGQGFIVGVSFGFDEEDGGSAMGLLPEAICRAALAATQGAQAGSEGVR